MEKRIQLKAVMFGVALAALVCARPALAQEEDIGGSTSDAIATRTLPASRAHSHSEEPTQKFDFGNGHFIKITANVVRPFNLAIQFFHIDQDDVGRTAQRRPGSRKLHPVRRRHASDGRRHLRLLPHARTAAGQGRSGLHRLRLLRRRPLQGVLGLSHPRSAQQRPALSRPDPRGGPADLPERDPTVSRRTSPTPSIPSGAPGTAIPASAGSARASRTTKWSIEPATT